MLSQKKRRSYRGRSSASGPMPNRGMFIEGPGGGKAARTIRRLLPGCSNVSGKGAKWGRIQRT